MPAARSNAERTATATSTDGFATAAQWAGVSSRAPLLGELVVVAVETSCAPPPYLQGTKPGYEQSLAEDEKVPTLSTRATNVDSGDRFDDRNRGETLNAHVVVPLQPRA